MASVRLMSAECGTCMPRYLLHTRNNYRVWRYGLMSRVYAWWLTDQTVTVAIEGHFGVIGHWVELGRVYVPLWWHWSQRRQ
jgi:hypothetical protein